MQIYNSQCIYLPVPNFIIYVYYPLSYSQTCNILPVITSVIRSCLSRLRPLLSMDSILLLSFMDCGRQSVAPGHTMKLFCTVHKQNISNKY